MNARFCWRRLSPRVAHQGCSSPRQLFSAWRPPSGGDCSASGYGDDEITPEVDDARAGDAITLLLHGVPVTARTTGFNGRATAAPDRSSGPATVIAGRSRWARAISTCCPSSGPHVRPT